MISLLANNPSTKRCGNVMNDRRGHNCATTLDIPEKPSCRKRVAKPTIIFSIGAEQNSLDPSLIGFCEAVFTTGEGLPPKVDCLLPQKLLALLSSDLSPTPPSPPKRCGYGTVRVRRRTRQPDPIKKKLAQVMNVQEISVRDSWPKFFKVFEQFAKNNYDPQLFCFTDEQINEICKILNRNRREVRSKLRALIDISNILYAGWNGHFYVY